MKHGAVGAAPLLSQHHKDHPHHAVEVNDHTNKPPLIAWGIYLHIDKASIQKLRPLDFDLCSTHLLLYLMQDHGSAVGMQRGGAGSLSMIIKRWPLFVLVVQYPHQPWVSVKDSSGCVCGDEVLDLI
jgi:hypothetical protein